MSTGTYISTKLIESSHRELDKWMQNTGIEGMVEKGDHHITLLYAENIKLPIKSDPNLLFVCEVVGHEILGEGEWQGLVLSLKCGKAYGYFDDIIKEHGDVHSYPALTLHTTVKYRPIDGDLDKLKDCVPIGLYLIFEGAHVVDLIDN